MKQFHDFFIAKAANGIGNPCNGVDWDKFLITLDSTAASTWTVKFQISGQEAMPDFDAAASDTNKWSYVDIIDTLDGASVDGGTGFPVAAGTVHKTLLLNSEACVWLNAIVSGYTGGGVTCNVCKINNNY
jgi:hypothetical protein